MSTLHYCPYGVCGDSVSDNFVGNAGPNTYAMPALNNGVSMRFRSNSSTRKIYGVTVSWATLTAVGTVTVRIETIDATTGKPTGTLYDTNAAITAAPSGAGSTQTFTFASNPTTTLSAGTEYAVVIFTASAGTAHTLNSYTNTGGLPAVLHTAADASTRSNFTVTNPSVPIVTLVLDDATETCFDAFPYYSITNTQIYGVDLAAGAKFTTNVSIVVNGIGLDHPLQTGSPGDLRLRLLDNSNTLVTGSTITIDKDYVSGMSGRSIRAFFDAPITLTAGTYRIVADQNGSGDSSNFYNIRNMISLSTNVCPTDFRQSSSTNMSTTFTWTDSTTNSSSMFLLIDSIPTQAGVGGSGNIAWVTA